MELVIKETLEKLLEILSISFTNVVVSQDSEVVFVADIETENPSLLIGRRGDTLAALQHMLRNLVWKQGVDPNLKIVVDVDGYKKRQTGNVIRMAEEKASFVISKNKPFFMPPMNPYLRRKVHLYLAAHELYKDKVSTQSVGYGDRRQLKIIPKT